MSKHLAIFQNDHANEILSGKKTVDFRFSKAKIAPYLKVQKGDIVFLKNVSQPVVGQVEVENVLYFDDLSKRQLAEISADYLGLSAIEQPEFDNFSKGAKYSSVVFFKWPKRFICHPKIDKKDRHGWLVIE